ncbi:MAG: CRISPR-associated ring nuclease [Candidatus Lokiarchaeia archaeon]
MRVWISTVGWSAFAVINPLWAACCSEGDKQFIPEKVILLNNAFSNKIVEKNIEIVKDWINRILTEYGVEEPIIELIDADEDNMNKFTDIFKKVMEKYKNDIIAIDMTPGRKFMSSIAMNVAMLYKVNKLFYLHLWGREYQNQPYIQIPATKQKLINIKELINNSERQD